MMYANLKIQGIYQHYKNNFYRILDIAFHHETGEAIVIYHRCNENGVYISIRDEKGNPKVKQPFYRDLKEFKESVNIGLKTVPRFKFIK